MSGYLRIKQKQKLYASLAGKHSAKASCLQVQAGDVKTQFSQSIPKF